LAVIQKVGLIQGFLYTLLPGTKGRTQEVKTIATFKKHFIRNYFKKSHFIKLHTLEKRGKRGEKRILRNK